MPRKTRIDAPGALHHIICRGIERKPIFRDDEDRDRFGKNLSRARKKYRQFLQEGVAMGQRPELTGGGLIRSMGGWKVAKKSLAKMERLKGDERILGNSDFVKESLRHAEEGLEPRDKLKVAGYGLDELAKAVAGLFDIEPEQIYSPGKYPKVVQARSLLCYWAVRQLGLTATSLAKKLHLTQPAVSIAVKRGEKIARNGGYAFTYATKL